MSELARIVRSRRLARDLTQRDAAARAGLSLSTWQSLERPTTNPTGFQDLTLTRAARCLRLSPPTLFRAAGRQPRPIAPPDPSARGEPPPQDPHRAVDALGEQLLALHRHAPTSFWLVHTHATQLTAHLLELHADPP